MFMARHIRLSSAIAGGTVGAILVKPSMKIVRET